MAVSISDLVQRVRDQLGERPYITTSTTTTTATTVVFADTSLFAVGTILEWQTGTVGFEQMYVRSITNGTDIVVLRGFNGTTAETHSSGDQVAILMPQHTSGRQIQQALTQAVNGLFPFVYKTGTVNLTPVSGTVWYDLNASTIGVVNVMQQYGSSGQFVGRFGLRGARPFEVDYNLPAALVASGKGMHFPSGVYDSSNSIAVTDMRYVTGTTDIEDTGQFPVADCVVLLAAGRLLQAKEISRVSQGESMDTVGSVAAGARLQTGAWFLNQGKTKLQELAIKYDTFYKPVVKKDYR